MALQPWLSGRSTPRELTLFKADLQRCNGQPEAARRSLQHLLRLHPNDLQVLQLLVLLDQELGRQGQVTAELTTRFKGLEPGQRLEIGLLLADLLRQGGSDQTVMKLYSQLATENKTDSRPMLALAVLQQELGDSGGSHPAQAGPGTAGFQRTDQSADRCCVSTTGIERSPQHRIRTLQRYGVAGGF